MKLSDYFEKAKGVGMLATADSQGKVDLAVFSRPHFLDPNDDSTVAFIMDDRLSHANIVANPHAAYSFHEDGEGYVGKRLSLTKVREETDHEKIQALRPRNLPVPWDEGKTRFLVYFRVDGVRPLIEMGTEI